MPTYDGDDVGDAVSGIDHGAGQGAVLDALARPRRGEGEDGLHGNVQPLDVERLEKDLGRRFPVLGRIQGRFSLGQVGGLVLLSLSLVWVRESMERTVAYEEKVVVLWFGAEVLEDALLPVTLHVVPIVDHAVLDRVVDVVRLAVGEGLVSDEEVEVFDAALGGEVRRRRRGAAEAGGLGRDGGTARAGRGGGAAAGGDAGRDDERGVRVAGEAGGGDVVSRAWVWVTTRGEGGTDPIFV